MSNLRTNYKVISIIYLDHRGIWTGFLYLKMKSAQVAHLVLVVAQVVRLVLVQAVVAQVVRLVLVQAVVVQAVLLVLVVVHHQSPDHVE